MNDENKGARLTALGREEMLNEHERRLDVVERDVRDIRGKEAGRDKRWDFVVKTVATLCVGIIGGVAVALASAGIHP